MIQIGEVVANKCFGWVHSTSGSCKGRKNPQDGRRATESVRQPGDLLGHPSKLGGSFQPCAKPRLPGEVEYDFLKRRNGLNV